jgi:putative oxidoreductase
MDTFDLGLLLLRLVVGLTFAAHGAQKVFGWWGGPGWANWKGAMAGMGFRPATLFAAISAGVELVGGLSMAAGFIVPIAGFALVAQSVVIIGQVHWRNGFFNTKGGYEFPLTLGIAAAAITLIGPGAWSVDASVGIAIDPAVRAALVVLGVVAGLATLVIPHASVSGDRPAHA